MTQRQILALFVCSLVPWTVGNGLLPLLPVVAVRLGAGPASAGNYLAFSYVAIACGAVLAGWVSDRLGRRKVPIIAAGLVGIPCAWLLGRTGSLWTLTLLTAVLWFFGGLGLGLIGILAGASAGRDERGKVFGILSVTSGLGALIGGLASGAIADRWGYTALFSAVALFLVVWPVSGLFLTEVQAGRGRSGEGRRAPAPALGRGFRLLFAASLVASTAAFVFLLGRSLLMGDLGFSASDIAGTGAVSGLVAMPLPLLLGWLSDRTGRRAFLAAGYLACVAGLLVLAASTRVWQFALGTALQTVFVGINGSLGNALVADLVPQEAQGKGLALFGATAWIGGVLGFAGGGAALRHLGSLPTFAAAMVLPLAALLLLVLVRPEPRRPG